MPSSGIGARQELQGIPLEAHVAGWTHCGCSWAESPLGHVHLDKFPIIQFRSVTWRYSIVPLMG